MVFGLWISHQHASVFEVLHAGFRMGFRAAKVFMEHFKSGHSSSQSSGNYGNTYPIIPMVSLSFSIIPPI